MKNLLIPILCICAIISSCSSDEKKYHDVNYHAKEFIQESKDKLKQTVKINTADLPKDITLSEGIKLTIPKDTFTKNGVAVTGEITLEAYEMFKPSNIIFSGTNTLHTSGQVLESDGFFYLDAKQNGISLDKNLANSIYVSVPKTVENRYYTQLWVGVEDAGPNENQFAWDDPDREDFPNMQENWIEGKGSFEFAIGKLGWFNCDIIWKPDVEKTTVTVALTGNVGKLASYLSLDGDTYVIFCAKKALAIVQLYTKMNETTVKSYDDSMPVGETGRMIAFSVKEGVFSYAEKEVTITKDMQLTLDLKEITKDRLESSLKALDNYK